MQSFKDLLETEHSLICRRQKNFDERVELLYKLEEVKMSKEEQAEIKHKVAVSEGTEIAFDAEIKRVRLDMKRYIVELLKM